MTAGRIALPTLLALAGVALVAGVVAMLGPDGWTGAYLAALVIAVLSAAATLPILVSAAKLTPNLAGPRVLGVGLLRAMIVLGLAVAAVKLLGLPQRPTMAFMMAFYLALLAAEAWTAMLMMKSAPTTEAP